MARPRSEEARQSMIAAAVELIAEGGMDGFTVDAVAKRSGVAKTTIYRHYESTNHLLLAVTDSMIGPFPTPNTGALRSDLLALYETFLPMMADPGMYRMMLGVLLRSAQDDSFRELRNEFIGERHQPIRTVLELAQARGEVPADLDLELAVDVLEGPFASKPVLRGEPMTMERAEAALDIILDGLLVSDRQPT